MVSLLRKRQIDDLDRVLSGPDWGMPIVLISPNTGLVQSVTGRVDYNSKEIDPESGLQLTVEKPIVTVALALLTEVPKPGENWAIKIPVSPGSDTPTETYVLELAIENGHSMGFIKLPLTKAGQS